MGRKLESTRQPLKKNALIPMERATAKMMGEFFGRNVQNEKSELVGDTNVIRIRDRNSLYEYHIDNNNIEEIKKLLNIPAEEAVTNLGRQNIRFILTLLVIAHNQYNGSYKIEGEFRMSDIVKAWEAVDGTKTRRVIHDIISSLYSSSFIKIHKIGQDEKRTTLERILVSITTHEKAGEETIYKFRLNEEVFGKTMDWIVEGSIPKSFQKKGFLGLPVKDISEKNHSTYYLNFRERLRLVGADRSVSVVNTVVKKDTLLRDWFKFSENKLKRRGFCHDTILSSLEIAKKEGELFNYTYHMPEKKGWQNEWSIEITKSNRK